MVGLEQHTDSDLINLDTKSGRVGKLGAERECYFVDTKASLDIQEQ